MERVGLGGVPGEGAQGDRVSVSNLASTGVGTFRPDFAFSKGDSRPNDSEDTLTVRGTNGVDTFRVSGTSATDISVVSGGVATRPHQLQPEDILVIQTRLGDDVVDTTGLAPGLVNLRVL